MTDSQIYTAAAMYVYGTYTERKNGAHCTACSAISTVCVNAPFHPSWYSHSTYLRDMFEQYFMPAELTKLDTWFGVAAYSETNEPGAKMRMEHRVAALLFMAEIAKDPSWVSFSNKKPAVAGLTSCT